MYFDTPRQHLVNSYRLDQGQSYLIPAVETAPRGFVYCIVQAFLERSTYVPGTLYYSSEEQKAKAANFTALSR